EVVRLEVVHVGLAAGAGQRRGLHGHRLEGVRDLTRGAVRIEPGLAAGVLGGDADRAAAGVAVVTVTGLRAQRLVAVGGVVIAPVLPVGGAVAAEGDGGRRHDRDG